MLLILRPVSSQTMESPASRYLTKVLLWVPKPKKTENIFLV
jgi:hypothetical protein